MEIVEYVKNTVIVVRMVYLIHFEQVSPELIHQRCAILTITNYIHFNL